MKWIFQLSLRNMKVRLSRTLLTLLGVTIGVISVMSLLSLGLGMKKAMLAEFGDENTIKEITVSNPNYTKKRDLLLTDKNVEKLKEINYVEELYTVVDMQVSVTYGKYIGYFGIMGVPQEVLEKLDVDGGLKNNGNSKKPELIVGNRVGSLLYNPNNYSSYEEIEGKTTQEMVGDKLDISFDVGGETIEAKLKIAGSLEGDLNTYTEQSQNIYCNQDVLIKFLKNNKTNGYIYGQPVDENGNPINDFVYDSVVVTVDDVDNVDFVVKKLQDMGYSTFNNKQYLESAKKTIRTTQFLLAGIGAIALIVAVIGISNTMTTSVYDRINDIGILKILGCDNDELITMFIIESGMFGFIGGTVGTVISFLIRGVINKIAIWFLGFSEGAQLSIIPLWLVIVTIILSTVLSLMAGYFPARWGSGLKPIDALRR